MKLSTKFRYAVRLMIRLGVNSEKKIISLNEIAKEEKLSYKYLSQIVLDLKKKGLINTIRGSKGGYYINKDLDVITLLDIYEAIEGRLIIIDCINKKNIKKCKKSGKCIIQNIWNDFNIHIKNYLNNINLKEIIEIYKNKMEE